MTITTTTTAELTCDWVSDNAGCGTPLTLIMDGGTEDPFGNIRRHAKSLGWIYDDVHGDRCPDCKGSITSAMEERARSRWERMSPAIMELFQ